MASLTPSPDSSPSLIPISISPPSPPDSTTNSPPPSTSQPDQTTDPPVPSTPSPPAASPPPTPPAASPPSQPLSPPPSPIIPSTPPPSAPPPSPPASPPQAPPALIPPSPPAAPPPASTTSPPPPNESPPPPVSTSPPPQASPTPPPPLQAVSPSPPPPANVPIPPSTNSPPPPIAKSPETPPAPPTVTTPAPSSQSDSPPPKTNSPPPPIPTLPSPPPSVPSVPSTSSTPPSISPPAPPVNSSATGSPTSPIPSIPTEKPTARATNDTNASANTSSSGPGGSNTGGAVAIGIVVGFVALSLLVMAVWFAQKRKRRNGENIGSTMPSPFASSQNSDSLFLKPYPPAPLVGSPGSDFIYSPSESDVINNSRSWFTYEELVQATNGFSAQNRLGEGGFGCVYKGVLVDGREVAVKQLKIGGSQGEREFRAEVEIISRVHHRHLVSLVGYCISEHQRLLVYDYLPNDTLYYHLHGEGRPLMDWATRVKVAVGAARGIAYLHEDCHPRIIHRDIKSSNILLDDNFEAQVSDFGLAKIALELDSNTHVSTRVMGTFGYMAPEYATSGKLTEKSDVYSFGVVLLELITSRKPVDASQPIGDESLVEWARPLLTTALENEDFEALVDPELEKNYVPSEMFRMIEAAAACVRHSAAKRPRMSQVVRALDLLDESSDLSNGMKPGQSEIFDSRQHSAQIRMFQRLAFGNQDYSSDFFDRTQSSWRSRDPGDYV
ncbi:hypothetical protein Peur_026829 [Populus x canadensis]